MATKQMILLVLAVAVFMGGTVQAAGTSGEKCAAAKMEAAGKKAAAKLKCYASATKKGGTVDSACLAKAEEKFTQAFVKAEAKGGCVRIGDAPTVENMVNTFVASVVQAEPTVACQPAGGLCPLVAIPCCAGLTCVIDPILMFNFCQ